MKYKIPDIINFAFSNLGYLITITLFSFALFNPGNFPSLFNNGMYLYFIWELTLICTFIILISKPASISSQITDYLTIIIFLIMFLLIGISLDLKTYSLMILINFLSNQLLYKRLPDIKIVSARFILLWLSVMIFLPIMSFIYILTSFFRTSTEDLSISISGASLNDLQNNPTNALLWAVCYFTLLILFNTYLFINKKFKF
jgi:hypothetical protein